MKVIKLKENDLRKYIAKIIKENQSTENYMFFSNLQQIHRQCEMLMSGKKVPNCVPVSESSSPAQQAAIAINMKKKGVEPKNESYGEIDESKNTPTNPKLWASSLAWARSKYDVCPSAYCNGAAAKHYKAKGGGWKKCK